ncbi:MAG: hypothetical protein PVG97_01140, partial [Syntrophobacterales bacterium]
MTNSSTDNKSLETDTKVGGESMGDVIQAPTANRKKAVIKASMLLAFVAIAIYIFRFTPVKGYLTAEALGSFLDSAGFWAPLVFIIVYT